MNPFRYRPHPNEQDWEDNWLSNLLAWVSKLLFITSVCSNDRILTKISNYLWAECACCLFFRGVLFGVLASTVIAILI
jgi:hypothetical protein